MRTHARARLILAMIAAWLVVCRFAPSDAIAGPLDRRELQARKDFAAGRYEQAAEAFAELFANTGDPIYLRNIGRCYQKLKRPAEAIGNFQDYLRKARNLSSSEREEVQGFIKEMEALQAAQQPAPGPAPAPPSPSPSPSPTAESEKPAIPPSPSPSRAPSPSPSPVAVVTPSPAPSSGADDVQTGRSFRIAGITTGAAGIALLATGLGFGLAAKSAADDVENFFDPDKDRAGKRYETLQWVGYGLGAAALGTGVFLYVYGRTFAAQNQQASAWQLRTTFGHGGGGLAVEGRF